MPRCLSIQHICVSFQLSGNPVYEICHERPLPDLNKVDTHVGEGGFAHRDSVIFADEATRPRGGA